ncbi:MAG TPA: energy transducer TonB [Acidobacteriaceae bacterium]|jgi:TonB family protein|nr:energy transducer TonB [Acidobacteriaceae bacterium]
MKFLAKIPLLLPSETVFKARHPRLHQLFPTVTILIGLLLISPSRSHAQAAPAPAAPVQEQPTAQTVQQPAPAPPAQETTPVPSAAPVAAPPASAASPAPAESPSKGQSGEITEDELKQLLVGKQLFLRGGYLGDSISFTEHGLPAGHPTAGPYTLSAVEIEKVRLTKHKVELQGARYGLHFLGALPYEDPSAAVDRVKITPKKKVLKISIDREQIVKEKKPKEDKKAKESGKSKKLQAKGESPQELAKEPVASSETDVVATTPATAPTPAAPAPATAAASPAPQSTPAVETATDAAQPQPAEDKAEDKEDKPADEASVTHTTSPAHAAQMLRDALAHIFAPGLDEKIKAQMPEFWQLYYQAQTAGVDYRPRDPAVLRSSAVDQQAKVLSSIAPDSNEYAQASGIAGRALYRAVIGADGKPGEIAVVRPIGFGLDENAVAAIRKATFQPATKAGQPVAETLDLAVLFRIYSKRTSVAASADAKTADPIKPGPYSVREP